ncbi:TRAM domain-containing protein [Salinicoccus sp. ID82-1]|uniref:TRAM domain-containing protein n=1 Tax=Salinicoccus cyprini TaxID=2493691 RepID=A0A558ARV6_9STAP|nr:MULTISPECIES: TRAM domain-containing protein [Salinicoccus]MCG1009555.1 TRAM domain-containing protein [Salinicoccus sp. ID82-1]TVT26989.1 TRAM domain-containing protein [Salinicoccus cyprini]
MLRYLLYVCYLLLGLSGGIWLMPEIYQVMPFDPPGWLDNNIVNAVFGIVLIYILFFWTIRHVERWIKSSERLLLNRSLLEISLATLGMIIGLLIAVLISLIINTIALPIIGDIIPFILAVVLGYLGFQIGISKLGEIVDLLPARNKGREVSRTNETSVKFLDTSAIIDGRIVDIMKTGFIEGQLVIPQFVLDELQLIADSTDPIKRDKGQRGLDMLSQLQEISDQTEIREIEYDKLDVDHQLIDLAKKENGDIITTDFNLNRVCQLHQIKVLNVNALSDAIKLVVLQGDRITILVSKVGKEEGQGVGYLEDGTMVVVDHGRKYINQTIKVEVTSVLQTNSGRIIFSKKVS